MTCSETGPEKHEPRMSDNPGFMFFIQAVLLAGSFLTVILHYLLSSSLTVSYRACSLRFLAIITPFSSRRKLAGILFTA